MSVVITNDSLKIVKKSPWLKILSDCEVPEDVLYDYDHLSEEAQCYGWVEYLDRWFHLLEFISLDEHNPFGYEWEGYTPDSYFSGVLVRYHPEYSDTVKLATYMS